MFIVFKKAFIGERRVLQTTLNQKNRSLHLLFKLFKSQFFGVSKIQKKRYFF